MDYEKKYNEALERAKAYHRNELAGSRKEMMEYIFPELRESEDEKMRRKTINCLTMHNKGCVDAKDIDECIAWLEKQEQKPAEWSEEDEDMLNCCISSIEEAKENRYAYKETDGDTSYDGEIAFLKSLRPSWKPSEEQMSMLLAVINEPNNSGAESCQIALRGIYEQLKKL